MFAVSAAQGLGGSAHIKSGFSTSQIRTITLKIGAITESLAAVQRILPPSMRLDLFAHERRVCVVGFMRFDHQMAFGQTETNGYIYIIQRENDKTTSVCECNIHPATAWL